MNAHMMEKLKSLECAASQIIANILAEKPCRLHAVLTAHDGGRTVRLAGNSEGLVYLASLLLSLAAEQREQQHYHFEEGTVLDLAEKGLVLAFQKAEWDDHS